LSGYFFKSGNLSLYSGKIGVKTFLYSGKMHLKAKQPLPIF